MKIYIQSKSGDFNAVLGVKPERVKESRPGCELEWVLYELRSEGGYRATCRGNDVAVPFEEIQFIRLVKEGDE